MGSEMCIRDRANANHVLKLEETPVEELTAANGANYNAADRVLDPEVVEIIMEWLGEQAG